METFLSCFYDSGSWQKLPGGPLFAELCQSIECYQDWKWKTRSTRDIVSDVTQVGMSINWVKPNPLRRSGADLSTGFVAKIGNLQ